MNIFLHIVTSSFIGSRCSFPHAVTAHPVSRDCAFPHTLILLQKAVDVIFDMSLWSFKEQWMLLSIYVGTAVSPYIGYDFPHVVTALFQRAMDVVF